MYDREKSESVLRGQAYWGKRAWPHYLKIKKVFARAIALLLVLSFGLETCCYGLATLPASQNPAVKPEITAQLYFGHRAIRIAETEDDFELLRINNARCLLLSCGRYLVTKEITHKAVKLLGSINHEDIEALMQVIFEYDKTLYDRIKKRVLEDFPTPETDEQKVNFYVNHVVASAFEWLLLIKDGVILPKDAPAEKKDLLDKFRKMIEDDPGLFTGGKYDFSDHESRGEAISQALNKGMRFYEVAGLTEMKSLWTGLRYRLLLRKVRSNNEPKKTAAIKIFNENPDMAEELFRKIEYSLGARGQSVPEKELAEFVEIMGDNAAPYLCGALRHIRWSMNKDNYEKLKLVMAYLTDLGWRPSNQMEETLYCAARGEVDNLKSMGEAAIPTLIKFADVCDNRQAIKEVLLEMGDEAVTRDLTRLSRSHDFQIELLESMTSEHAIKPLMNMMHMNIPHIRKRALSKIANIGTEAAAHALIDICDSRFGSYSFLNDETRAREMRDCLMAIGQPALSAVRNALSAIYAEPRRILLDIDQQLVYIGVIDEIGGPAEIDIMKMVFDYATDVQVLNLARPCLVRLGIDIDKSVCEIKKSLVNSWWHYSEPAKPISGFKAIASRNSGIILFETVMMPEEHSPVIKIESVPARLKVHCDATEPVYRNCCKDGLMTGEHLQGIGPEYDKAYSDSISSFRGTMEFAPSDEQGFVRLDPPVGGLEDARVEEMVETIRLLARAVNSKKKLVLLGQPKKLIETCYEVTLPGDLTLEGFALLMKGRNKVNTAPSNAKIGSEQACKDTVAIECPTIPPEVVEKMKEEIHRVRHPDRIKMEPDANDEFYHVFKPYGKVLLFTIAFDDKTGDIRYDFKFEKMSALGGHYSNAPGPLGAILKQEKPRLVYLYNFRGSFGDGFVRLDPPVFATTRKDTIVRRTTKLIMDIIRGPRYDYVQSVRMDEKRIKQMVEVIRALSCIENPQTELILYRRVKRAVGRYYKVKLPQKLTLHNFLWAVDKKGSDINEEPVRAEAERPSPADGLSAAAIRRKVHVKTEEGLHARSLIPVVEMVLKFSGCRIFIKKDDRIADARSMAQLLTLAADYGEEVEIIADGPRANQVVEALASIISPKNLSRGSVDELGETHPALERAANDGRMFTMTVEQFDSFKEWGRKSFIEKFTDILMSNLENLESPSETRKKIIQRLNEDGLSGNIENGLYYMREALKGHSLPGSKPIRLCIIVEEGGLPTIVFKDLDNNLIAHSACGKKTGSQYVSIYTGCNTVKTAVRTKNMDAFNALIRHEVDDIARGDHRGDEPQDVSGLYNNVLTESALLRNELDAAAANYSLPFDRGAFGKALKAISGHIVYFPQVRDLTERLANDRVPFCSVLSLGVPLAVEISAGDKDIFERCLAVLEDTARSLAESGIDPHQTFEEAGNIWRLAKGSEDFGRCLDLARTIPALYKGVRDLGYPDAQFRKEIHDSAARNLDELEDILNLERKLLGRCLTKDIIDTVVEHRVVGSATCTCLDERMRELAAQYIPEEKDPQYSYKITEVQTGAEHTSRATIYDYDIYLTKTKRTRLPATVTSKLLEITKDAQETMALVRKLNALDDESLEKECRRLGLFDEEKAQGPSHGEAGGDVRAMVAEAMGERWVLAHDLAWRDPAKDAMRTYTINYDKELMPYYKEDIEMYAALLEKNANVKVEFDYHSRDHGENRALIEVTCDGDDGFKGTGRVDVPGYKGEEHVLRIIDMLNIAVASASISDKIPEGELSDGAQKFISYIKKQCRSLMGEAAVLPDSNEEMLKKIKEAALEFPPAFMRDNDRAKEYEELSKIALRNV